MIGEEIVSIIGSLLGLLLGFCVSLILARYILKSVWSPKMLGVLNFNLCNK
jgi:ABC-type lipoprotein release transport system permease subunit